MQKAQNSLYIYGQIYLRSQMPSSQIFGWYLTAFSDLTALVI